MRYEDLILKALRDIAEDVDRPGSLERGDLQLGVRTLHLRFSRDRARSPLGVVHNPRHFILYPPRKTYLGIIRILQERRDLQRHLPNDLRGPIQRPD